MTDIDELRVFFLLSLILKEKKRCPAISKNGRNDRGTLFFHFFVCFFQKKNYPTGRKFVSGTVSAKTNSAPL